MLTGLILYKYCTSNHSCCDFFMCATAMSYSEDSNSQLSSPSSSTLLLVFYSISVCLFFSSEIEMRICTFSKITEHHPWSNFLLYFFSFLPYKFFYCLKILIWRRTFGTISPYMLESCMPSNLVFILRRPHCIMKPGLLSFF